MKQLWQHTKSGEVWIVEVDEDGWVEEAAGPLHYTEMRSALTDGDWDIAPDPELVDWMNAASGDFTLHEIEEEE